MIDCRSRRFVQSRRWVLWAALALAALSALACSGGAQGPTAPDPMSSMSAGMAAKSAPAQTPSGGAGTQAGAVAAEAPDNNGQGHGNGHGHGHGPGGGGGSLELRIAPDVWNTNYTHSEGTVTFMITGADAGKIDLGSIMLTGDNASATPLAPLSAKFNDHHVLARFAKEDVIGLVNMPKPGEMVKVTLSFTVNGTATTLSGKVRIVGPQTTG
jgi:hypothetical protein